MFLQNIEIFCTTQQYIPEDNAVHLYLNYVNKYGEVDD
jgi:hypothetical protein